MSSNHFKVNFSLKPHDESDQVSTLHLCNSGEHGGGSAHDLGEEGGEEHVPGGEEHGEGEVEGVEDALVE